MKSFKQLLEDIQVGPAPEEISYKGYTTKNLHHVPDAAKAFQATITRVQKGTLQDNGEVLAALKATDTYMKLNDMHLEQEKDLDSKELDQWLAAHEEAKSALTKIGEFEHHYDYWNSHNTELQYLKANQNMPQEAESVKVDEASKLQGTPVVSLSDFGSKDNTKNKYGQTVPKKLKPNDPRVKMYTEPKKEGVAEGLADDFLAMAKNRNPNARIVTAVQKRKETEELMKKREASGTKPAHAAPTSNPRPLGGHDPKSGRSYSESVEPIDELSKTTLGSYIKKRSHDVATQGAATRQHAVDAETARKDQDYDQQRKSMASSDKAFMKGWKHRQNIAKAVDKITKEEVELDEVMEGQLRNFSPHSDLAGRGRLSGYNKTAAGKKREADRETERLKDKMKFTKSQGGIAGPKGKLPEEVKTVEEGFVGRETKDGTWRVFKTGQAVAVAGPFKSREEASAWIKKQSMAEEVSEQKSSLPPHLQKLIKDKQLDKKPMTMVTPSQKEKLKATVKDVTPKGYGPNEEVELDEKTLTPAELKKREEVAKAMERKNPNMDKSRKMAIATAVAKRVAEQYDDAE